MEYHITFTCEEPDFLTEFDGYGYQDDKYKFGINPFYTADFSSLNDAIDFTKQMVKGIEETYSHICKIEILYARVECEINIIYLRKMDGEMVVDWRYIGRQSFPYDRDISVIIATQKEFGPYQTSKRSPVLQMLKKAGMTYDRLLVAEAMCEKRKEDRKNASKKGNN